MALPVEVEDVFEHKRLTPIHSQLLCQSTFSILQGMGCTLQSFNLLVCVQGEELGKTRLIYRTEKKRLRRGRKKDSWLMVGWDRLREIESEVLARKDEKLGRETTHADAGPRAA